MELLGAFVGLLEALWDALRSLFESLAGLLESLGNLLRGLDGSGGSLLVIWEASWEDLGASWSILERSWGLLGRSWNLLEEFREPPGTLLGAFGRLLGDFWKPCLSLGCVFD